MNAIELFAAQSGIFALMNTAWGWPIAESLHFLGLSLLIGTVGILDLRMLGFASSIPVLALHRLVRWGVAGFVLNVITGVCFFVSAPDQYLYNPAFQLKVLCMLIAAANLAWFYGVAFPRLRAATEEVRWSSRVAAGISLLSWTGVIVFGRLITFYRPPEHWCFWCS